MKTSMARIGGGRRRARGMERCCLGLAALILAAALQCAAQQDLLRQAGFHGGLVVRLGWSDPADLAALHNGDNVLVHGLTTDPAKAEAARRRLLADGVYGAVAVDTWDGARLPYADNLVNVLIAADSARAPRSELLRVVAPRGVLFLRRNGKWEKVVKSVPADVDEWTHYLYRADGNPASSDKRVGPPARLQWDGGPRWARHHDHMASLNAMVSSGGRVFYIIDEGPRQSIQLPPKWRLVARDAYNGVVLWKRSIPKWASTQFPLKSGPAHLLRRLVAVGDRVYVTLGIDAPVSILDAATGRTLKTLKGSEHTREIVKDGDTLLLVADNGPSRLPDFRREGTTYVWANTRKANPGWGWNGEERRILAYGATDGTLRWKVSSPVAPCSLAAGRGRIVFHDSKELVCLNETDGKVIWKSQAAPIDLPVWTNTGPRVLIYRNMVLFSWKDRTMSGWRLADGKKVWEAPKKPSGHMSLRDLYVVDGLVWSGDIANPNQAGVFIGYDPFTGEKKRELPPSPKLHWFHHRCYPARAAGKYIITARDGTEFVEVQTGAWKPHHWVRGGCIYGVMPANGLLYAPMHACGCQEEAMLNGLNALAPGPVPPPDPAALTPENRLIKGPAYGKVDDGPAPAPDDWPMYRHDEARSGAAICDIRPDGMARAWKVRVAPGLTQPVIAAGRVYVASKDTHTVYALDAGTGRILWTYTAGGPVDSPPVQYRGLLLFGCRDGKVYALRARDGAVAWIFRAAPEDRRVVSYGRIESAWPVHGSVLVHDGVIYCTAGRNMFLDGGIRFLKIDAATGKLLGERVWDDKDPETGRDIHYVYLKKTPGNTMPVAASDILSCDGRHIWMRSQKIQFDGKRVEIALQPATVQNPEDFHLYAMVGFLDDSWFFRSYWLYGRRATGGYGSWFQAGRYVPAGRILCVDDAVYGFGRLPAFMTNASVLEYHLFAAGKTVKGEDIARVNRARRQINSRSPYRAGDASDWRLLYLFPTKEVTAAAFRWSLAQPAVLVRAMGVSKSTVVAAGPPALIDERQAFYQPDDPEVKRLLQAQVDALAGKMGAELWILEKKDGRRLARYAMDECPVFDGIALARGRIFMSTVGGEVCCLAPGAPQALRPVRDRPERIVWSKPEDPHYLLPPPEPRDKDFDVVRGCKVFSAKANFYCLRAAARKTVGLALKKLDAPISSGRIVIRSRIRPVLSRSGYLNNGFIAFGEAPEDAALVKCGARIYARQVLIVQGPLLKGGKAASKPLKPAIKDGKAVDLIVEIDLDAGKVRCRVGQSSVETTLKQPPKRIAYVGYAIDSALIDMAPFKIVKKSPAEAQ